MKRNEPRPIAGVIAQYIGSTPPPGWLLCDGSTFSAEEYPALYAVLGTTTLPDIPGTPVSIICT